VYHIGGGRNRRRASAEANALHLGAVFPLSARNGNPGAYAPRTTWIPLNLQKLSRASATAGSWMSTPWWMIPCSTIFCSQSITSLTLTQP